jgi:polysaccharide biosynthesis protein PslH
VYESIDYFRKPSQTKLVRILFLTQVLPYPLDAGPKVRAYYVLRHLAREHDVTLVSFVRPTDTPEALAHLHTFCHTVYTVPINRSRLKDGMYLIKSLVTGHPFIIERDWVAGMADQLGALVVNQDQFDAIHADQLWMAPYALWMRQQATGSKPLLILDQHNAVYMIPLRMAQSERNPLKRALLQLEARKLMKYEIEACQRFDHVAWVTQEDYEAVENHSLNISVPNSGIIPICGAPESEPVIERKPNAQRVTFLGGLHYPPNAQGILWFAQKVFPQVLAQRPDAVLTVIGKQPPAELQQLGIPTANLEVTGYVNDPKPYLAETAVFIVPLLAGGGMRVKIVEGWTWGLPIVSTTVGAEGIDTQPGDSLVIADSPDTFAHATVRLLQDRREAERIARAGRQWVLQHYNWCKTYHLWDRIYCP